MAESNGEPKIRALLRVALDDGAILFVPAIVVTETFRDRSQDALLNRLFKNVVVDAADFELAKVAGRLLAVTGTANAADAQVVANALHRAPCTILTSDEADISLLVGEHKNIKIVNVDKL